MENQVWSANAGTSRPFCVMDQFPAFLKCVLSLRCDKHPSSLPLLSQLPLSPQARALRPASPQPKATSALLLPSCQHPSIPLTQHLHFCAWALFGLSPRENLVPMRSTYSGEVGAFSVYPVGREKWPASKKKTQKKFTKIPPVLLLQNQPSQRNTSFLALHHHNKTEDNPAPHLSSGLSKTSAASISKLIPREGAFCSV